LQQLKNREGAAGGVIHRSAFRLFATSAIFSYTVRNEGGFCPVSRLYWL
jgi:hypothetical protein